MSDDELTPQQRKAKALRMALQEKRAEHGLIAGTPGTLGDANSDNSMGSDVTRPIRTEGLDE